MIRGKYLRERKAIRIKRRLKFSIIVAILLVLYKIIFSSFSLYESEASSNAQIDVAFYLLNADYQVKTLSLDDMLPGNVQYSTFTLANYYVDENGKQVVSETDMECDVKIRTTTNLPLQYELYVDQDINSANLVNRLDTVELEKGHWDEYNTIFKYLVDKDATEEEKAEGITDTIDFSYETPYERTYILKVTFPEQCKNYDYQDIMECLEIAVDSRQIVDEVQAPETEDEENQGI